MTHREAKLERARCEVRRQESRVAEAKSNLEHGYKRLQAEMEREYAKLKCELEREQISLEAERAHLKAMEDNALDAEGDLI